MVCHSPTKSDSREIIASILSEWLDSPDSNWSCTSNSDLAMAISSKVQGLHKNKYHFVNIKNFMQFLVKKKWFGMGITPWQWLQD